MGVVQSMQNHTIYDYLECITLSRLDRYMEMSRRIKNVNELALTMIWLAKKAFIFCRLTAGLHAEWKSSRNCQSSNKLELQPSSIWMMSRLPLA